MDSNADLPCQPLANSVTKQELIWLTNKQADQLRSANSSFNLLVITGYSTCLALFSTQRMWLCLFHAFLHARQILFLNAKPNLNLTKNCLCTSNEFGCGKIVRFRQDSNLNSVTPLKCTNGCGY